MGTEREEVVYSDYVHTDRLGSVVNLTDQYGRVPAQIDYDDWGKVTAYQSLDISGGYRTVLPEITYAGHQYDDVLGMYYAKARMYDAENRRFAAEDAATISGLRSQLGHAIQDFELDPGGAVQRWSDKIYEKPT